MIYYQIIAHNPADHVDEVCKSHIYPSYLTCFSEFFKKTAGGNKKFMLQSNPHDGVKFIKEDDAKAWMKEAQEVFPHKEFEIISFDGRFYGRITPRYVVGSSYYF